MLILYYHNIVNTPLDEFDRKLSRIHVDEFAAQMRQVAKEFHPISLAEMFSLLVEGKSDPKAVAVTFDDGYFGVVAHGLPVLRELGIPATVFVVTDHVREPGVFRLMHFDELEVAFRLTSASSLDLRFAGHRVIPMSSAHARVDGMKQLKKLLKVIPDATRQQFQQVTLEELGVQAPEMGSYGSSEEKFRTASWDELREARDAGLSVGSHTCSHRVLSQLERGELEHEVLDSLTRLRERLDADFLPFAYPYGSAESIGAETPALVQKAGYSCALTTISGKNAPPLDPFLLRRVEFEALNWPW